jgi:hypothetical protein
VADQQDPGLLRAELLARVERAREPYDEAVWRLLLGDAEAGLDTIRRALPDLLARTPANLQLAKLALLAGDPTAPDAAAAAIDDTLARFVPGSREYHATLLALMAGDDDQASRHQTSLAAYVATHDKLRGGEPAGIADVPRGLLDQNADRLTAGIQTLLAFHLRRARARSDVFNSSRGVISLDAIVALILCHRRGLDIPVQATYRAAQIPLLVLHLTEWQGRPLPRAMPISVVTDLVAGPWLRSHGLTIEPAPAPVPRPVPAKRTASPPAASPPAEQSASRHALQARVRLGGSPWQLASWAMILGDPAGGRAQLETAAAEARRRWQASAPQGGGLSRWFSKDQALPNQNFVREHFALALVIGDEAGLRETTNQLQAWLRTQEGKPWPIYGHAHGYLDHICDLIGGGDRSRPSRDAVEQVMGPLSSARVAAIALADRDPNLLREALESMLSEHAKALERKSSPPAPVCAPAVHFALAARRLGMPVAVDERFAAWPVPIEGARVPCDLLGRALWGLG